MDDILKQKDLEISTLKLEIESLKERLKKYTNPQRQKKYQENNKEKIIEYAKEYQKKKNVSVVNYLLSQKHHFYVLIVIQIKLNV